MLKTICNCSLCNIEIKEPSDSNLSHLPEICETLKTITEETIKISVFVGHHVENGHMCPKCKQKYTKRLLQALVETEENKYKKDFHFKDVIKKFLNNIKNKSHTGNFDCPICRSNRIFGDSNFDKLLEEMCIAFEDELFQRMSI
jgi:hypothetical protein